MVSNRLKHVIKPLGKMFKAGLLNCLVFFLIS